MKIPFLYKYMTEDQEFYDTQINEELKYSNSNTFNIEFVNVGKSKRAFVIRTNQNKSIILLYKKSNYIGINEALGKIRLNLALLKEDVSITTSSNNKTILKNKGEFIVSTVDQLLINDLPLKSIDVAVEELLNKSLKNDEEKSYLDFYEAGYDAGIQNYLIMNLYNESIMLNDRLVDALSYYKMKEPRFYYLVNCFLSGNFEKMTNYLNSLNNSLSISSVVRISQNIIQALEEIPDRRYDLMIYRAEVENDNIVGKEYVYERFSSFSSSKGVLVDVSPEIKPIVYRKILKKDEKAIPIDIIENLGIIYLDGTQENEFLLSPFTFKITGKSKKDNFDVYDIKDIDKIDSRELLYKRVEELEEYLIEYSLVEYNKLKKVKDNLVKKAKKNFSDYNMKDIYYGLRLEERVLKK